MGVGGPPSTSACCGSWVVSRSGLGSVAGGATALGGASWEGVPVGGGGRVQAHRRPLPLAVAGGAVGQAAGWGAVVAERSHHGLALFQAGPAAGWGGHRLPLRAFGCWRLAAAAAVEVGPES